jgi:hypothetical protein
MRAHSDKCYECGKPPTTTRVYGEPRLGLPDETPLCAACAAEIDQQSPISQHKALCDAIKIIKGVRYEVSIEQSTESPAWTFLYDVGEYLRKQAEAHFASIFREA